MRSNGWQVIQAGRAASAETQRENDWIEALALYFRDYDKVDLRTRTLAYEAAMAQLTESYPDDDEAAIFYALALNDAIDLDDKTYTKQFRAAAILQAIEAKQPNHPGIPHYLIHSYDFAPICQQGLPAASATRNSHLRRHMRCTCPHTRSRCWVCGTNRSRQT